MSTEWRVVVDVRDEVGGREPELDGGETPRSMPWWGAEAAWLAVMVMAVFILESLGTISQAAVKTHRYKR